MFSLLSFRGGVLEPAGTVEIKFRRKDLVKAMHRLDTKCQEIAKALASAGSEHAPTPNLARCNALSETRHALMLTTLIFTRMQMFLTFFFSNYHDEKVCIYLNHWIIFIG